MDDLWKRHLNLKLVMSKMNPIWIGSCYLSRSQRFRLSNRFQFQKYNRYEDASIHACTFIFMKESISQCTRFRGIDRSGRHFPRVRRGCDGTLRRMQSTPLTIIPRPIELNSMNKRLYLPYLTVTYFTLLIDVQSSLTEFLTIY
uniref:Uncharacterized protein n=1 Tax=Cacopsylla melanoneura TaxID=428564 RepID=A0A8D8QUI2_9HEMI